MSEHRPPPGEMERLHRHVLRAVGRRVRDFRVVAGLGGLVLLGRAASYVAKQLTQDAVMGATSVPVAANLIEVD